MDDTNIKLEKALKLMRQRGLNGLIIYSNGVCNILRPGYLLYFSGFKPMGPRNAAILSKSGEVALLVEPPWDSLRASEKSWIKNVEGGKDFVKDLIGILRRFKISGPVGVVGSREMTQEVYVGIQKEALPKNADDIIEEMAKEKTRRGDRDRSKDSKDSRCRIRGLCEFRTGGYSGIRTRSGIGICHAICRCG